MTWHGWLSLGVELLLIGIVLGALARLGGRIYRLIRAEIRIWRIQKEIDDLYMRDVQNRLELQKSQLNDALNRYTTTRRIQLDGLATASDKASRRITH